MAGASAALATAPASGVAAAIPAAPITTANASLFAVVSPGQAWGTFSGLQEACNRASMIRHSGAVCTSHLRCTPAFAEQLQHGALKSFVEIDGWAVTSSEAETRGLDLVRRAADRAQARNQLRRHHIAAARQRVEVHDAARSDVQFYISLVDSPGTPARISAVNGSNEAAQLRIARLEQDASVQKCSSTLADALRGHLHDGSPRPDIISITPRHCTAQEHAARIADDPLYRMATNSPNPVGKKEFSSQVAQIIAYDRTDRWIYGCGINEDDALASAAWSNPYRNDRNLLTMKASPVLSAQVCKKGLECAGLWQPVRGVARHESELPSSDRSPASDWRR